MMQSAKKAFYPKTHLLAASGVAALLSLALLVFPSTEVEAKKTAPAFDGAVEELPLVRTEIRVVQDLRDNQQKMPQTVMEPAAPVVAEPKGPTWKTVSVEKGDTLANVFAKAGLPTALMHEILAADKKTRLLARLDIGQNLEFLIDEKGALLELKTKRSDLETLSLSKTNDNYSFKHDLVKPDVSEAYAHGKIDSSLFAAGKEAELSYELIMALADIFAYDIDFALDLREGDEFDVIYESKTVDGKKVGTGNILAARFVNQGKEYTAVRYTNKGNTSYYRADGTSMRKAFIRTPVDFARISSRFSLARSHPILNRIRAHKGVDYAAPTGTPIKATGDGKVVESGRKGGYGKAVVLQHGKRYRTIYGHMSSFAKGIRPGTSVKQGQIIGYVGMTGLATGPHLHYEFQVNGTHVDPLSAKLPMADPLPTRERKSFVNYAAPLFARMDQEKSSFLALNKP